MTINCTDFADTIDGWVRINRPSSQSNSLAPTCADYRAGCAAPASAMFRRRWTSASVTVSEDLCCAGVSSLSMWFTSRWMFCFSGFQRRVRFWRRRTSVRVLSFIYEVVHKVKVRGG